MHRSFLMLATALLGLAVAPVPQSPATASCAAPFLESGGHPTLQRSRTSTIRGVAFVDGCRDSMTCSALPGCDSCEYEDPPPEPYDDVRLRLVQDGHTWLLDAADAERGERAGRVTWTFELPRGARSGRAELHADHARPVPVRIG